MPASHLKGALIFICAATVSHCGGPAQTVRQPTTPPSLPPLTRESVGVSSDSEVDPEIRTVMLGGPKSNSEDME